MNNKKEILEKATPQKPINQSKNYFTQNEEESVQKINEDLGSGLSPNFHSDFEEEYTQTPIVNKKKSRVKDILSNMIFQQTRHVN
mmetsp:Transcript_32505/g.28780  ORF Transcript_32505/g.28780 Transcript_32505/m.28780 type:complete len:85 (+) Transcript_32505:291-545(+)